MNLEPNRVESICLSPKVPAIRVAIRGRLAGIVHRNVRGPLFRAPLIRSLIIYPYLALFSTIIIQIRLNKDIYACNEGAPNRGPLKIPMNYAGGASTPHLPSSIIPTKIA